MVVGRPFTFPNTFSVSSSSSTERVGVAELLRELPGLRLVLEVERDAQHHRALRRVDVWKAAISGFLDARRAPRRPEVHHHPLAAVVGQAVALAVRVGDLEGERRGRGEAGEQREGGGE